MEDSAAGENEPAQRRRLKIGSQRIEAERFAPGPPLAKPKPKPVAPAAPLRPAEKESDVPGQPPAESKPPPAVPVTMPDGADTLPAAAAGQPSVQIDDAPLPTGPVRKVPRPNVRESLSAELEQEIADALGDVSLDDALDSSAQFAPEESLDTESPHRATVVSVRGENVFVDLGGRNQGIVPRKQFPADPQPGAAIEVIVNRFNRDDGLYELSLPGAAVDVGDWSQINEGIVVDAVISGHNSGGLECEVSHIRGFIPVSQISLYRVEDLEPFVGQKLQCVVVEANPERRNLVLSHRAVLERQREQAKQKLMEELAVGQTREGVVRRVLDFGAFVDLGGVDGLIPVSQMSWERVRHPSDVLAEGQKVNVRVEKIDAATGKIGLAYRETWENPWDRAAMNYPVKSVVEGTVTKLMDFGAFVKLEPGIEGLIHISELAHRRVFRAADVVSEGQTVEVQIVSVDSDAQRIGLSLKALEARAEPANKDDPSPADEDPPPPIKSSGPLKGGVSRPSGGEQFGLNW